MKKKLALLSILVILGIAWAGGFHGLVYKAGSGDPLGYAKVHVWNLTFNDTVGCNARGTYGIQNLDDGVYYLEAWKQEGEIMWRSYVITDTVLNGSYDECDIPCTSQGGSE